MKPRETLGLLLGAFGIVVLDIGFVGASMTDLLYLPQLNGVVSAVPSNLGGSVLGNLMPGGNTTLFLIGAAFLVIGMMILILHNRNLSKSSISAVPLK